MSRIQNILDKAEREGAVRRIRPLAGPTLPAVAVVDPPVTLSPPPTVVAPEPDVSVAAASAPMRLISGARLSPSLIAAVSPSGIAGEQYRALRTRIVHRETGGPVNVVLITSPGRSDGKSLTVANLGLAMAQEYQQRICVVDADFRSPQQHRLFGLPDAPGLSDVLTGRVLVEDALVALEEHHISVLPAGTRSAHPAELFGTTTMRRTLEALRLRFDRIVIDAPAAAPLADVGILTPLVDSIVLIVRAGITSKPAIHDAIAAVDAGKLLGIVLNEAA
jgi:capsular exopolysaccharide synthesis family protein